MIAVEALQRSDHLLGVFVADLLERIDAPGAAHNFLLDLFERALRRDQC
jgi:hypothetical protein